MKAQLVFAFPFDTPAHTCIAAVCAHFGIGVPEVMQSSGDVPEHIKQAVENTAAALGGAEMSAAVAFGGLLNGSAGNAPAAPAQSSAGAATSPSAPVVNQDTSATTPPASLGHVPPTANGAVAPVASAAPTNLAANGVEFDVTGLAWDERIHSGAKSKTPGGEWRARKGTDKSLIKSVEAELRARYGSGNAPGTASATGAAVTNTTVGASVDPAAKRAAALQFAHAEAIRVAGPQVITDADLAALNEGKATQLTPQGNEWYGIYFAKRNAAFTEYMQRETPVVVGNVAYPSPDVSASQTPTGTNPAASAVTVNDSVAAHPAGVGQPAATTVSLGELDAAGLPHDPRINVGAKIKDNAGVWVQRHDVSGETKLAVMAELRAKLAGNVAAQASNGEAAPAGTPVVPPLPSAAVTADDAGKDFAKLMRWIVGNQIAGRISQTAGPDAARDLGFRTPDGNGALALMNNAEAAPYWAYVVQMLQGQGAV